MVCPNGNCEILQDTLERMGDLEKSDLRINEKVYARLSRFEPLFGFQFEGEALRDWLLSRIRSIRSGESWTVAVNRGKGRFVLGKAFFEELSPLERIYLLVHEARHSDGDGYPHVRCPRGFKFISAAQPEMDLEHEKACDSSDAGAYAFQAALLFELYAFGLFDQREVGSIYNSSVSRVLE